MNNRKCSILWYVLLFGHEMTYIGIWDSYWTALLQWNITLSCCSFFFFFFRKQEILLLLLPSENCRTSKTDTSCLFNSGHMICCPLAVTYLSFFHASSTLKEVHSELLFVDPTHPPHCTSLLISHGPQVKQFVLTPGLQQICPATVCVGKFGWAPYVTGCL